MPQYVSLKTENDFCNSIIEPNHALLFSESTENGIVIKAKISDGTFTNIVDPRANGLKAGFETLTGENLESIAAGITSLNNSKTAIRNAIAAKGQTCTSSTPLADYAGLISNISGGSRIYKCVTVGTDTWTGYLGTTDSTTGVTTFAATATSLTWSLSPAPQVGKVYTEDGLIEVTVNEGAGKNGMLFYDPLTQSVSTSMTGQALIMQNVSFGQVNNIPCAHFQENGFISFSIPQISSGFSFSYLFKHDKSSYNNTYNTILFSGVYEDASGIRCGVYKRTGEDVKLYCDNINDPVNGTYGDYASSDWQHAVIVSDGTTVSTYINGVKSSNDTQIEYTFDTNIHIGCAVQSGSKKDFFNGYLKEFKLWNRALSQSEITAEYNYLSSLLHYLVFYAPLATSQTTAATGQTLTANGTVTYTSGHAYFGGNSYLTFPDTDIPMGTSARTISFLFSMHTAAPSEVWPGFVSWGTDQTRCLVYQEAGTMQIGCCVCPGSDILCSTAFTADTYHHCAVTYNGTSYSMYIDGVLIDTKTQTNGNTSYGTVAIGAYPQSTTGIAYLDGTVSDLKILSRAWSQTEVTAEYNRLLSITNA